MSRSLKNGRTGVALCADGLWGKDTMQRRINTTIRENVIIAMSAGRN